MHEMGFSANSENVGTHKTKWEVGKQPCGVNPFLEKRPWAIRGKNDLHIVPKNVTLLSQAAIYTKTNFQAWKNAGFC
jgi:hypothetical protein